MRSENVPCGTRSQIDLSFENHLFQQLVFADVGSDMPANLSCGQQKAHAQAIHSDVVADGGEILCALLNQRADQIFRIATEPEAADHNSRAVEDIVDGLIGVGNDLVHEPDQSYYCLS